MPKIRTETIKLRPLTQNDTGPLDVVVGGGIQCDPGAPSIQLDMTEAFAYFSADPVPMIGVMDIWIQNLTECYSYFTWEMKMWDGVAGTTCPTTAPEIQEISRFLGEISAAKVISVTMLRGDENKMVAGSFGILPTTEGNKTVCLSLWGNHNKKALIDELLADGGYDKEIPWM